LETLIQTMPDAERVRRLEATLREMSAPGYVRQLEASVKSLSAQVEQLSRRLEFSETRWAGPASAATCLPVSGATGATGAGTAGTGAGEEVVGGAAGLSPAAPPPSPRFEMPEPIPDIPLRSRFGPGFEFKTSDDEFNLQFHDLTQFDGRFYQQSNQRPVADTFAFPRQWLIFSGHMTKPYEYYISIAEGFDTFNILDVFLNVNFNKAFQFRVGRFKTPFTYEFYAEPTQGLANGEWSLFFNNFGFNRDSGGMLWGQALRERLDYAAGIFNSGRNGFIDVSDPKQFLGFLNFAPFKTRAGSPLENLNVGGSVAAGQQKQVPSPQVMRTIVPTNGNLALGVPFLELNNNVLASGPQALWSLHTAYYYKQLSLIGEWAGGFEDYALTDRASRTRLPVESFYIQAAYLLTGERVASRGLVKPFRPFDLRKGKLGFGAWELAARFSQLDLGNQVFTGGLADPSAWTNRLFATDLGVSWYWNQYIRVLFDWQHAEFGNPVLFRPGQFQKTSDLFLLRFQLWF
jgi:phosphate-selective porin OprO/OprP